MKNQLNDDGRYFLANAEKRAGGKFDIDLDAIELDDDLACPVVRLRSKIPTSERMRKFGVQALGKPDWSGEYSREHPTQPRHPIPTEQYIESTVRAYGDRHETRTLDPEDDGYRGGIIERLNQCGRELRAMIEYGEFALIRPRESGETAIMQIRLAVAVQQRLIQASETYGVPAATLARQIIETRVTGQPSVIVDNALGADEKTN